MRSSPLAPFLVALAACPVLAQTSAKVPTQPPGFVEQPGVLEFRGVMLARPLQREHAARFGLTEAEIARRAAAAVRQLSAYEILEHVVQTDEYLVLVPDGHDENSFAALLMADGNFQYVEPDWTVYPIGCPNDPQLGTQWHHNASRMNSCAGWDLHTGNSSTTVGICDTGLRITHVEFQANRKEGYNAVDQLWESQGGQLSDPHGHGTSTTGCAAANGNNSTGVSGVGWNLGHRILKVSNDSSGGSSISILTHAARTSIDAGDKVASVSYSGVQSSGVDTTGGYIRQHGGLLVWAAGNEGATLNGSRDDNVIVVGATTSSDTLAWFSNRGPFVDLVAPGEDVYTTSAAHNNAYSHASGTSFACPLVSGLAGLIWSYDPTLTPTEVETILRQGCDDLGTGGVDNTYGYGRIDVRKALELVNPCDAPSNFCLTSPNSHSGTGSVIGFNGSNSVADNDLELFAFDAVPNQSGIFFHGNAPTAVPFGNGWLCATSAITRYPVKTIDFVGFASQSVDVNALGKQPGDTSYFQFWFRDPMAGGGGFNTSDGLMVPWCP